jgi:hypothetical protein
VLSLNKISDQSWLDYRIQRLKFLFYVSSCVDYFLTALVAASTHTNYFDRFVKERGAYRSVESDYYTEPIQLVNI